MCEGIRWQHFPKKPVRGTELLWRIALPYTFALAPGALHQEPISGVFVPLLILALCELVCCHRDNHLDNSCEHGLAKWVNRTQKSIHFRAERFPVRNTGSLHWYQPSCYKASQSVLHPFNSPCIKNTFVYCFISVFNICLQQRCFWLPWVSRLSYSICLPHLSSHSPQQFNVVIIISSASYLECGQWAASYLLSMESIVRSLSVFDARTSDICSSVHSLAVRRPTPQVMVGRGTHRCKPRVEKR